MTKTNADARIARFAHRQGGTFSRAQALALGMTDSSMHRRIRAGRWLVLHPGVYLLAGVPPTWHTEIWAALRWPPGRSPRSPTRPRPGCTGRRTSVPGRSR